MAQTASASSAPPTTVSEVIVTAQKREQAAKDVPIALSVITASDIRASGATSIEDLQRLTPSLQIVGTGGPGNYSVEARGVANLVSTAESSAVVGLYLDETPISSFGAELPEVALFDVSRVEFLRGPQGTLYGEGSEAGTLRFITNKPNSQAFSGLLDASYAGIHSGGDDGTIRGVVNIPLVTDQLAIRIAGNYERNGGWIDVPDLGRKDANRFDRGGGRIALRWTPTPRLIVDASWLHQRFSADTTTLETSPGVYQPSAVNPLAGPVRQLAPYSYDYDVGNLTLRYDLGFASLVSSSSYFRQAGPTTTELSPYVPIYAYTALGALLPGQGQLVERDRSKLYTEELRLASEGKQRLDWTVGAFFRHLVRDENQAENLTLLNFPAAGTNTPIANATASESARNNAYALFGEGTFHFTPQLSATVGLRYYSDNRRQNSNVGLGPLTVTGGDTAYTPNFVLTYQPDRQVTLYAKAARGFRSGGENPFHALVPTVVPETFGPETLWSYEGGAKTQLLPWLTANAYLFYNDWKNLQLALVTGGIYGYTGNAGKARSDGLEIELAASPAPGLDLGANATLTDSKITDNGGSSSVKADARTPLVPKTEFGLYAGYRWRLQGELFGFGRVDYQHRSSTYSETLNVDYLRNPASDILNLRAGVEWRKTRVSLFANNTTNDSASLFRSDFFYPTSIAVPLLRTVVYRPPQPRTVGVEISTAF